LTLVRNLREGLGVLLSMDELPSDELNRVVVEWGVLFLHGVAGSLLKVALIR
jgi:hypothetical protein